MIYQRYKERKNRDVEIDLSPMIDCIFILLIFFIVTSVFIEDPGVEVERPNVSGENIRSKNVVIIAITDSGHIYYDGSQIQIDQVRQKIKQSIYDPDTPVIIRGDKNAKLGVFAAVYTEAKKAGVGNVQFATQNRTTN